MKRLFILTALLSAAALVSCQNIAKQDVATQGDEIKFSASVGDYLTKVSGDAFENGDAVALTALSPINVNGVKLTWTNGAFLPEQPVYWGRKQTEETLFAAVYPYNNGLDIQQGGVFTTGGDQSDLASYTQADLLVASTSAAPGKTVHLPFRHVLSRVDILLRSELPVETVVADNLFCDAYVYPLRGTALPYEDSRQSAYIPYETGNGGYSLVTVPQTSTPKLLIYTADGGQITFAPPQPITLESGKIMHVSVSVTADKEVTFSSEILPWEEGESFEIGPGEQPDGQEPQAYYVYDYATDSFTQMERIEHNLYTSRVSKGEDYDRAIFMIMNRPSWSEQGLICYGLKFGRLNLNQWNETDGDPERYLLAYPESGTGIFDITFDSSVKMIYITEFEPSGE